MLRGLGDRVVLEAVTRDPQVQHSCTKLGSGRNIKKLEPPSDYKRVRPLPKQYSYAPAASSAVGRRSYRVQRPREPRDHQHDRVPHIVAAAPQ